MATTSAEQTEQARQAVTKAVDQIKEQTAEAGRTAAEAVNEHRGQAARPAGDLPIASLLLLGAVLLGGGLLVARVIREENEDSEGRAYFSTAVNGLGPKASDTVSRIRDAAFAMVLMKTVDTIEEIFPGFRQHFRQGLASGRMPRAVPRGGTSSAARADGENSRRTDRGRGAPAMAGANPAPVARGFHR